VLLDRFQDTDACLDQAKKLIAKLVPLDIKQPKPVGGIGCFTLTNVWEHSGRRHVGEAAGLQDFLWGFGIRSSIRSGWLAARSMIERKPYEPIAKQYFERRNKAAIVNRYLWEKFGDRDYSPAMYRLKVHNPFRLLRSFYNFNILQRAMFPLAKRSILKKYPRLQTL
jgi:flavin-dependent dehydrogenase